MPYDPTKPANNSPVSSAELRGQMQNLKALIDLKQDSATLDDAVAPFTAGNCEGIGDLSLTVSDPPEQAEVQAIVTKINEMLFALRRI